MRTTIHDVARIANVAPSTVSRVIANNPKISQETRDRVIKIMEDMNYHPNIIARSLANRSTRIIGVVVPGTTEKAFQHPVFPELLRGIASAAHKNKYNILISSVTSTKEEKMVVNEFARGGITEGIILTTSRLHDQTVDELKKMKFPFVVIGRPENENEINWVDNNNFSAGYELTKHFISQGHTKIAYIGLSSEFVVTLDRFEGYKKVLEDNGIPIDEKMVVAGKFIDDGGYELMKKLLDSGEKPTGVIACDDLLAFGAIKLLVEYGIRVPDEIAVAGFNNVPLSDYFLPSLTSVEINGFNLGSKAFEVLLDSIKSNYNSVSRAIIPAELKIRESTRRES